MILWLDGEFLGEDSARIDPADRGFTLADGIFDTLLVEDGTLRDADPHFNRLARHAAVLSLPMPVAPGDLPGIAAALIRKNNLAAGRYALRTTLTRGAGARGLMPPDPVTPTLLLRVAPAAPLVERPLRLVVATTTRRNERSPLSRVKSLGYGDNLLALMEARRAGADDAILLNTAGNVACASASNVFIREGDALLTPLCADGALDGIVRQKLLASGEAVEATISADRLRAADAIILTNSIAGRRAGRLHQIE